MENINKLPQIPESFIKAYVEANGEIDEVMVEYESDCVCDSWAKLSQCEFEYEQNNRRGMCSKPFRLKTRDDNTVIIHEHLFKGIWNDINPDDFKAEKTYSREDLVVELHSIVNDEMNGLKKTYNYDKV